MFGDKIFLSRTKTSDNCGEFVCWWKWQNARGGVACGRIKKRGLRVGVISRGYGSKSKTYPLFVTENTNPIEGGDEPVLIAKRTNVPVVISRIASKRLNYS